jgi:hypothetical protein
MQEHRKKMKQEEDKELSIDKVNKKIERKNRRKNGRM